MKISSLFNPTYGIIRSIIALLLGLAIVIWPDIAVAAAVRAIGAVMILIGGVSLAINFTGKERLGSLYAITGVIAVLFGIVLLVFPDFFVKLLSYLFGVMMIFFSIGQIVNLISIGKNVKVKFSFYIIPILIFILGIVLLTNPFEVVKTLFIVFGLALIVYAVFEMVVALKFRKVYKAVKEGEALEEAAEDAVDVEVIESKPLDAEEDAPAEAAAEVEDAPAAEAGPGEDSPEE
ncbi:MAG: DUF308 domain-containing protein [Bacteroidales bacterium]|nr:DUF308 domain-containing protein [Bacteroidales bacterium]